MEHKVILNYDNLSPEGLEKQFPGAVLVPFVPGGSKATHSMCDTVVMRNRSALSTEQMCAWARKAAPLAKAVIILGRASDPSHDEQSTKRPLPPKGGLFSYAH